MVDKKAVAVATIIALALVGVILFLSISNINNYKYIEPKEISSNQNMIVNKTNILTENKVNKNTVIENTIEENNVDEKDDTENAVVKNTISENKVNAKTENSTKKVEEKDPEKIAISLAKEKWGNTNSDVYFDIEDKNESKGIYTIVVRDNSTTVEMVTYKVDINKKTVTE